MRCVCQVCWRVVLTVWSVSSVQTDRPTHFALDSITGATLCSLFGVLHDAQSRPPLPSRVLHLQSGPVTRSPLTTLLRSRVCPSPSHLPPIITQVLHHNHTWSSTDVRGTLLVMECSPLASLGFPDCAGVLADIASALSVHDHVTRRVFVLALVYADRHDTIVTALNRTLMHSVNTSQVHSAIVTFVHRTTESATLEATSVHYIRPLVNACLLHPHTYLHSFGQLNLTELGGRLAAVVVMDSGSGGGGGSGGSGHTARCDFQNRHRLTAVITKSFFCEFTTARNGSITFGRSIELNAFRVLATKYRFEYAAVDANGNYGRKEGGVWLGSIGLLVNRTADLALCDLIYTFDRTPVVDFTFPWDMEPISFLTKLPGFRVRRWAFFFALPVHIWLTLLATFTVLGTILTAAIRIRVMLASTTADSTPVHNPHSPFMLLLSIFFQQSFCQQEMRGLSNAEIRFIILLWSFASLIVMRVYSGTFYSTITVPEAVPPIDSVAEVWQAAVTDTALVDATSRYMYDQATTARCCHSFDYDLGQHIRRNQAQLRSLEHTSFETRIDVLQHYQWSRRPPLVFITSRSLLMIFSRYLTYAVHVSSATFMLDAIGVAHRKDALYGPWFSETIIQMLESGLSHKWFDDTLLDHEHRAFVRRAARRGQLGESDSVDHRSSAVAPKTEKTIAEQEAENMHNFGLDDLGSVFILYLCGNLLAVVTFFVQLTFTRLTKSNTNFCY